MKQNIELSLKEYYDLLVIKNNYKILKKCIINCLKANKEGNAYIDLDSFVCALKVIDCDFGVDFMKSIYKVKEKDKVNINEKEY